MRHEAGTSPSLAGREQKTPSMAVGYSHPVCGDLRVALTSIVCTEPGDSVYADGLTSKMSWKAAVLAAQFTSATLSSELARVAACSTERSLHNINQRTSQTLR